MKHCSRRLMALLLSAILCVQLLPAMVRAEEGTAAASEGKGAFGLPAATGLTAGSTEYNSAVADAPFGSSGRAVPLFVKSELMLSYSWGGAPLYSHTYDYNGDGSKAGNLMGAFPNLANQYRVTFNSLPASAQASYRVAATDGVNTGSGRQEHIAMIGLSAAGIELSLRDRNNNAVHTSAVSYGNRSWINRLAFELGGFAAIACGDFDGDGVDSVVVYVPPTQGNGDAKLMEYTISSKGSSLTLTESGEIGNVYELLGVRTLIADHIQNVPVVQLTAADTDKDGYDELVITAGLNDTYGYNIVQNLGTQVFLYDRLEGRWTQTFKYAPSAGNVTVAVGDVSAASKLHRYVWGSSSVGNVLASDDSSNGTDFPEIVTAGMIDYSGNHNISINNKTCGFSMVRCVGMTEAWAGVQKNFKGQYEFLHRQTHDTNTLTTHGLYSGDEVLSPLIVKCFRYQGGAQPDAVFFSGNVYVWEDNSGNGSLAHKYTHGAFNHTDKYIGSTKITNKQVQAVAVGNFDGNGEGREQVVFASLVKQSGTGNHYSTLYTIGYQPKGDNSGYEFRHSETNGWFISKQSGAYVCLTDFNYDSDSTLVRYVGVERQWTDYDVLAVLEAVPYFEELGDDLGEGRTAYGKSSSSGSGSGKSHSLNTTVLVGYEVEVENSGAGFETTIENNFTWATNVSRSIEHSVDYENNSGENAVVVYRVPVLVYTYQNLSDGKDMTVMKTLPPHTSIISVEEYNEEAVAYRLEPIAEDRLAEAGNPFSYRSNVSQITNAGGSDALESQSGWSELTGKGNIEKTITVTKETEKSFEYELSVNVVAWKKIGGAKVGGGAGYTFTKSHSKMNGTGTEHSGSVNSPKADGYGFSWNFAMWNMTLNGKKVPALGYLVKDVSAPSSPPRDLAVETLTSTGATLTWRAGSRPAEEYRIYRVIEGAARPYAFVGAVSGTKNSFELNDLAGDVSYTFVARGCTNGVESVDSSSISFTTPKENGTNYVQVSTVADQTVRPGEDAVFSATVFKSDPKTTLTMQWQERSPGSPAWKDVRNATSSRLTVRDAAVAMNGTQYRLMVTAYTLAESSAVYYYSNAATLTIGALPTSVSAVTVTHADGGNGTQSDPYYGGADWTEQTTATQEQSVQKTASFEKGGVQGTVYRAGENGPYIGVIESKTTQGGQDGQDGTTITKTQYYQLTGPDSSKQYTATGDTLSPVYTEFNGTAAVEGFTAALAEGQLSKEVIAGETSTVCFAVAHWDGLTAKPTFYWESGGKYFNDDSGTVGKEAELEESNKPQYSVFHRSKNDEEIVLFGEKDDDRECFFLLKKSADTDSYTVTEVDPAEKLLIDGAAHPLSSLMPVSYSETVEVSVDTYKQQSGSKLTLTAEVTSGNGKRLAKKPAAFVITDTATGESFSIAVTTDTNGTMTMEWTAPTQGVYTIHAAVTADGGYAASSSKTPVYYAALGKDTEGKNTTLYRLLLTENGKALGASVEYGADLTLQTQKWNGAAWTQADETVSYQAAAPGAAAADIDTGFFPQTAGQYTFSAKDRNGGKLASAVLTVTPRGLTIRPVWGAAPTALQDIRLDFEGALERDKAALTNSLTVSDINEYFSNPGRTGVFTFAPQWKESENSRRLQSAYSVTLQTDSLRREADAAPVYYQVAATGHGTIFGSYGSNQTNFSSGENRKQGEPLVFQANPETGYQVSRWLVNGTEVGEGSPYRIGTTTGLATQTLSIDAFSIDRDTRDGQLKVEVEFANQFSVIHYSAGEKGSVTARTGGGSTIANNAKVTYGSSVTFTAVPQSGYMVEKWTVNGTDYTWPGAGKLYREEELTLSGLDQTEYTVTVSFVTKKTFTAAEPTLTDGQGNPVSAGTVAITWARTGETVAAGSVLPQGTALTYTVTFTDTSFNTVNRWEYSTDGEIWKEGGSGGSFTLYDTAFGSDPAALYVRAVVAVANTHHLSWKILGLAAEDGNKATLTASSNGTELASGGSYAANTPVDFTLTLDGSYDLVSWSENVTPAAGGRSAELKLAADTEVTVTVAKKPVVTIERTANGAIEVSGTRNSKPVTITSTDYVDPGTNLTVTIKPDTGYVVNNPDEAWTAVDNSDNHTYTIYNVRADQTLSADFAALDKYAISYSVAAVGGSDNGTLTANTVRKNMAAYTYGLSSDAEVYEGSDLTFTAAPDNGYRVQEWRVNGEVYQESGAAFIGTQLVLRGVDEEKTVMVQFMPLGDKITASAGEHGRITGAMAGGTEQVGNIASGFTLAEGASVTFTAEPDTGYEVEQWSVNGTPVSGETDSTYTYTAGSAGAVITVAFRPVAYTVSWTAEHGTVTADGYSGSAASIRGGTQVTFTAAPHNGYVFDHWTIDGKTLTNETATLRWTVPTGQEATMAYAIEAVFTENTTTYSVTYDASGGGTITAEGHEASPATVTYGQNITFTAVPAEYGYVKEWRVDGVPVSNSSNKTSYTLENVTQAHTVTVVFATAVRYDVSYAVNGVGGTLSAAADGTELALPAGRQASVAGGSRLVFAAVPSSGMMTDHWTVNGSAVTRENMSSLGVTMDHCLSNTLTIESLSRNVEVKAAFAEYRGFSIPTGGPGYEISGVKRLPADTPPATEIRAGGDVTFTVRPAAEYSDFSKLTVNGYDCLTGSGKAAYCETVSARKNADGSYTVTLTGVTGNISADIAAHKLVIGELTVPQVLESHPDLDTEDKIKLRLETMMIGTAENRAFYDIALRYKNAEGKWVEVNEANFPTDGVEVVLPYPNGTDSKDTFTIVHMLTTAARAGELELVSHTKQADGLHFRVTSLSPFGVSWVKYAAPSGGGSGGSGGSGGGIFNPAYNIMVERTMNGSITVSPSSAAKGSTVTIMVYPDRGYELEMLMVMDKKGSELDLRKWGGEYSFIMPAGDVTVRARFVEEAPTQSFADVSTDAYYYEAVKWAAKNGITGGVGNGLFAPDAPCTRAQIVTFLWRAAGSPEPKNASSFSDVPASAYYARSVAWAVENGITTGTGNGRFSPDATCTRAQSVTFLYRALRAKAEGTAEFRDVPKNAYYADAVAWAAANGITTGIGGGLFGPDNDCTRAQIVTFLFRTYNK